MGVSPAREGGSVIPAAIFLCDKTGIAARPWAAAGIECWCVDIDHSIRRDRVEGNIHFVWGDVRSWRPPPSRRIIFVGAFPPCTHVAVSGARDFAKKRGIMLRDALETFEAACQAIAWSGAPGFAENPVGILSSIPHIGPPTYWFHPADYAGYLADPSTDAYTKKTGIWPFNGFIMPDRRPVDPVDGSKIWRMAPSDDRADLRSATPAGFSLACFAANCPPEFMRAAA